MAARESVGVEQRRSIDSARAEDRLPWPDSASAAAPLSGRSEAFGLSITDPLDLPAGTDLGGVTIVRLLGEGGMGRVYEARQSAPLRPVAVKVLREAIASREQLVRFEYEAELLGRLRHPGIAQIHAAGTFGHGPLTVPFFIMELVADAQPITDHARTRGLDVAARVALFRRVCDAVAHGHRKGVIHRDLKPANILVDGAGDPKVIDFGVARSTAGDPGRSAPRTAAGQLVGTVLYMSPEQLDGRIEEIDARSDVYALGLVLHELVAERLPHGRSGGSLVEAAREARDAGLRAARAVERAAAGCGRSAARSLAAIVGTCLAADAADRYATAGEVAAELDRWCAGEPVLARPPTWFETLARLARRHRAATVAAVTAAAAIAAAGVGISVFAIDAARQARAARAELYAADVLLAAESRDRDAIPEARRRLDAARGLAAFSGSRQPCELACVAASLDDSVAVAATQAAAVMATAWSPDATRLAVAGGDGTLRLVSAPGPDAPRQPAVELVGHEAAVWRVAWSPDGKRLASASADKTARVWDAATGRELLRIEGHAARVYGVAFSRDGAVLATSGADALARLWDAATGNEIGRLAGHTGTVYSVTLTADGRQAVTASQDGTVRLWDVAGLAPLRTLEGHGKRVFQAVLSPDESRIASASEDGTVRVWRVSDGRTRATLRHPFRVNSAAFTADGRHVVTAAHDGVLRVFSASRGQELRRMRGHDSTIWTVSCASAGAMTASGSEDGTARLWIADGSCDSTVKVSHRVRAIAFAPDGSSLAVAGESAACELWDARTLLPRGRVAMATTDVRDIAFLAGGSSMAAACDDGTVKVRSVDGGGPELRIPCHGRPIYSVAFSADGALLATASEDRSAAIRALANPDVVLQTLPHRKRCFCARFSPDGRRLYTACEDGRARAWDVATGRLLATYTGHERQVNWLAVSSDGALLASASSDGTVGIWRAADATLVRRLVGPSHQVWKVGFSPLDDRAAAVSADGAVHLWDVGSGRPLPVLRGHADEAWAVAFSPDGRTLATGSWDGTVSVHGVSAADLFHGRQALSPSRR